MHSSTVHINPDDVFDHPAQWTEISSATAHLRSPHVPVVAVYTIHGVRRAVLVGAGWATERACNYLDDPATKFYLQVGTNPNAAKSAVPTTMALSQAGADFIGIGYENPSRKGYDPKTGRYYPYDDGYGYPTIGYGHLIKKSENFSQGLAPAQVQQLFVSDISGTVASVNKALKVGISQNQFDALVSLTFNVGIVKTEPVKKLNSGRAVHESNFTTYDHVTQGGKKVVSKGLLARRKAEWTIFSKDTYNAAH